MCAFVVFISIQFSSIINSCNFMMISTDLGRPLGYPGVPGCWQINEVADIFFLTCFLPLQFIHPYKAKP